MTRRVFLAVHVPEQVKKEVGRLIAEMRAAAPRAAVKWVQDGGTHITLHFLGNQSEEAIRRVSEVVREAVGEYQAMTYVLREIGCFPNERAPRVIYIRAAEADGRSLESLQEKIGKGLERLGIPVDRRPWHPHVTLGRAKEKGVRAAPFLLQRVEPVAFAVDAVELVESHLEPSGARYETLEKFPLSRA